MHRRKKKRKKKISYCVSLLNCHFGKYLAVYFYLRNIFQFLEEYFPISYVL